VYVCGRFCNIFGKLYDLSYGRYAVKFELAVMMLVFLNMVMIHTN
jgi:hypothetical protein